MDETRVPILVGSGQVTQRDADPAIAFSPIDLTAEAGRKAADDSGAGDAIAGFGYNSVVEIFLGYKLAVHMSVW